MKQKANPKKRAKATKKVAKSAGNGRKSVSVTHAEDGVTISCCADGAQEVFLAGTFNEWNSTAMDRKKDDQWESKLDLSPGRYEFKFVVDGEWCCEPGCTSNQECKHCVTNEYGTMNRVVEVAGE